MTTSQSPSMRIAARCCFTVGTDPGWVRMYAATWSGETSRNPRPRASHHARKLPYRPPVRRPRPRVRDPPREELQIPPPVAGPASTITCGRTISPPCPSRPPAPRPPAPEPPSSFRHHLSPTADSPVDERLEPLVVVPERVGQRVELLQRMLRPAEPHLDPVPFDGDPPRGRLASFASRVSTGSFTRIPSGADAPSAPGRRNHPSDRQQIAPVRADPFRFRAGRFGSPGDQLAGTRRSSARPANARVSRSCRLNFQARGV